MYRALIIKELRECAPLAAVAGALAACALYLFTRGNPWPLDDVRDFDPQPFLDGNQWLGLPLVAGSLSVLLGLKQAAWEDLRGAYYYLLHRPIGRSRVFAVKAAVGVALVQGLGAAMIVIYGLWAATPGTHASPFFWAMTLPAWQVWLVMPVAYMGALLTGLRPGRWFGSRLAPLAGCLAIVLLLLSLPTLWMSLVGVVIAVTILLSVVMYVAATRDY